MTNKKGTKINRLLQAWPRGTVATQTWLTEQEVSSNLATWYVGAGWLLRFGPRAFLRQGDQVDWRGGLYAMQTQLAMTIHVGVRSALELQGRAHFVPLGSRRRIIMISGVPEQLPAWFRNHPWDATIEHHVLTLFDQIREDTMTRLDCGNFQITMASAERAIMEEMRLARTNADVEYAIQLMEHLTTLRPHLVQQLLEHCTSIKVKRLFLWSAEQAGHPWLDRVDLARVELGSGKRQLYRGGSLDPKYQITVPRQGDLPDA